MNLRPIHILIEQAKHWRAQHKAAGRQIEAAACDVRIAALEDAIEAMEKANGD
jgi:hypothetical protein